MYLVFGYSYPESIKKLGTPQKSTSIPKYEVVYFMLCYLLLIKLFVIYVPTTQLLTFKRRFFLYLSIPRLTVTAT